LLLLLVSNSIPIADHIGRGRRPLWEHFSAHVDANTYAWINARPTTNNNNTPNHAPGSAPTSLPVGQH
jgi:hypothetical protein